MRKHKDLPITFCSWYQCNRLDEISSGMEDLVESNELIARGEEFNICKSLGYDILPGNPTEAEAYRAGRKALEEERMRAAAAAYKEARIKALQIEAKKEKERKENLRGLFWLFIGLPSIIAAIAGLAWLLRTIFFIACDGVEALWSLICANVFLITLLFIPSIIIFAGYKIESKKKQNKDIK